MNLWVVHFGPQLQRFVIAESFTEAVVMAEGVEEAHAIGGHLACPEEKMIVPDGFARSAATH